MKPKRHYIPIVPDKPKQGPKITRLFSWKKHKAEKPQTSAKPKSKVWKAIKYLALAYGIIMFIAVVSMFISINNIEDINYDDDFAYNYQKSAANNQNNRQLQNNYGGGSSGYCSTDSDCAGFGARNGGIAICSNDKLCRICYSLMGQRCISCSTGCDANTYCERGVCVFYKGGKTTD